VKGNLMTEAETLTQKRTRRIIKQAMINLLQSKRFDDITVKDICDSALIHRSTFYRYYQDKIDLADDILHDLTSELSGSPTDKTAVLKQITQFMTQNVGLIRHLVPENESKFYDEFRHILEGLFQERVNNSDYQNDPIVTLIKNSTSPTLMMSFLANIIMGFFAEQLEYSPSHSLDEVEEFLVDIINKLNGI
jgi:AcrR family transcriptional regulator